jgi:conjugative transfer signal peptidase TraF
MIRWQPKRQNPTAEKRTRYGIALSIIVGINAMVLPWIGQPRPLIVYNASPSVPLGYYWVTAPANIKVGDLVLLDTPERVRDMADRRRYLPRTVPMIKHVAALEGDEVCADTDTLYINQTFAGKRHATDLVGRPLPHWEGCHVLGHGEVFLLNRYAPLSFDSRYFGPVSSSLIIGRLHPL